MIFICYAQYILHMACQLSKLFNIVREKGDLQIPLPIRNAPTKLMKELNYGKEYKYAHDYENNFTEMEFLPEEIKGTKIFEPGNNAKENEMRRFLKERWGDKYGYWDTGYKGGSWADEAFWCSPGSRRYLEEDKSTCTIGFRCCMIRLGGDVDNETNITYLYPLKKEKK